MTMTLRRVARVPLFVLAGLAAACSSSSSSSGGAASDADGGGGGEGACKTGANAEFANPAGTPYALPAGITLVELTGNVLDKCLGVSPLEYGSDVAYVCMVVENTTNADIEVTLPAGLAFVAQSPRTQNGILLQEHKIKVAAGETKNIHLRLSCIDEHCKYTDPEDVYVLGNVTTNPGLLEIIDLVKSKQMSPDTIPATQNAVWAVTDGGGLTDDLRDGLRKMPSK